MADETPTAPTAADDAAIVNLCGSMRETLLRLVSKGKRSEVNALLQVLEFFEQMRVNQAHVRGYQKGVAATRAEYARIRDQIASDALRNDPPSDAPRTWKDEYTDIRILEKRGPTPH